MIHQFLWVIYPYLVLIVFIGGVIFRYQHDQFGWTTKSSEMLEKKKLAVGSSFFHWGLIFVFGGHVMGILIPEAVYTGLGISGHLYHKIAIGFGVPAGIISLIGLVILFYRRISVKRIRYTSSVSDILALVFLLIVMLTGLSATLFNITPEGFDYRKTISPWFRGLFYFQPNPLLMETVPLWFKMHILSAFSMLAIFPFTRLVHAFSMPLKYLRRSYVIYRKRVKKMDEHL
jgi:nitrate reductase gamma subunit